MLEVHYLGSRMSAVDPLLPFDVSMRMTAMLRHQLIAAQAQVTAGRSKKVMTASDVTAKDRK